VWAEARAVLAARQPRTIALNTHAELAFAGGLHAGERDAVAAGLGADWAGRFVLEPMLAVELVATMVPGRLAWYRRLMETAWAVIDEAFSAAVIDAAPVTAAAAAAAAAGGDGDATATTTDDVVWWMRERIQALNYTTWFQPSVYVLTEDDLPAEDQQHRDDDGQQQQKVLGRRRLTKDPMVSPTHPIRYGDIIHTDFGVTALGLNTDTQHLGYVLRPGETEADIPQGFLDGLKKVNRLQDITREKMQIGRTGNEILADILAQARREGIEGKVYCHATGEFGHSAGTVIGKCLTKS
jgi:hypothetical protein